MGKLTTTKNRLVDEGDVFQKIFDSISKNEINGEYYMKDVKQASKSETLELIGNDTSTIFIGEVNKNTIITGALISSNGNAGEAMITNDGGIILKGYISKYSSTGASNIHFLREAGDIVLTTTGMGATDKTFFGVSYITEVI